MILVILVVFLYKYVLVIVMMFWVNVLVLLEYIIEVEFNVLIVGSVCMIVCCLIKFCILIVRIMVIIVGKFFGIVVIVKVMDDINILI